MRMILCGPLDIAASGFGLRRLRRAGMAAFCGGKLKAFVKHAMKWPKETEFLFAMKLYPTKAFHVFQNQPQPTNIFDLHLPQHCGVTVKRQVREAGNEKVLVKQEVFDGSARVISVINHDKGED